MPNQQYQSTEGKGTVKKKRKTGEHKASKIIKINKFDIVIEKFIQ